MVPMATYDEDGTLLRLVQEKQALHRRLMRAKRNGVEPDPADVEAAAQLNASPYAGFDRVNAPDER